MFRGQIALGDGKKARKPRFGCEQIVEVWIQRTIGATISNGEKLPVGIEQEFEFHPHRHGLRCLGNSRQPVNQ